MKKLLAFGFISLLMASHVHAGFISIITGADMAGMNVSVTYENNTTESLLWEVINVGNGLPGTTDLETAKGGVTGSGFTLYQQGNSLGNSDDNGTADINDDIFYGLWTLTNTSSLTITNLLIDALAGNIVFDIIFDIDVSNGSDLGRPFMSPIAGLTAEYTNPFLGDELFGTMSVDLNLLTGEEIIYFADTDAVTADVIVNAPSTIYIFMLSLFGFAMNARRKQI
jgi:hypothetical protein